jgi:hypothetical protein
MLSALRSTQTTKRDVSVICAPIGPSGPPHKGTTALAQAGPVLCAAPEMVRVVRDENCAVLVNEI